MELEAARRTLVGGEPLAAVREGSWCCLLCERRFRSERHICRHLRRSEMHRVSGTSLAACGLPLSLPPSFYSPLLPPPPSRRSLFRLVAADNHLPPTASTASSNPPLPAPHPFSQFSSNTILQDAYAAALRARRLVEPSGAIKRGRETEPDAAHGSPGLRPSKAPLGLGVGVGGNMGVSAIEQMELVQQRLAAASKVQKRQNKREEDEVDSNRVRFCLGCTIFSLDG